MGDDESLEGEEPMAIDEGSDGSDELDSQFAADAAMAFPELDDAGLAALQRAVMGLMAR